MKTQFNPSGQQHKAIFAKKIVGEDTNTSHLRRRVNFASLASILVLIVSLTVTATSSDGTASASDEVTAMLDTRSVKVISREEILASGAVNLHDFLPDRVAFNSHGMFRPIAVGADNAVFMVNGHQIPSPYSEPVLGYLPISAVERIEIYSTGAGSLFAGGAIGGSINIVLRSDLVGTEAWAAYQNPSEEGAQTGVGGGLWGGKVGQGELMLGGELYKRKEIRGKNRDYSRPRFTTGGDFGDVTGVSVGGNTLFLEYPDPDNTVDDPDHEDYRYVTEARPLGSCSQELGYTGELNNPFGSPGSGCGYVYGNHIWETEDVQAESLFARYEYPLGNNWDFYFDARFVQGETEFEYAPSVGYFVFTPSDTFRARLNELFPDIAPIPQSVGVFHRFVAHGNRNWKKDTDEVDMTVGVRGVLPSGTDYDLAIRTYRYDALENAATFVSDTQAQLAVQEERYNIEDPFSTSPAELEKLALSSRHVELVDRRMARAALYGTSDLQSLGRVDWTSGIELEHYQESDQYMHFDSTGKFYPATDILGSGGLNYAGDRSRLSGFLDVEIPLRSNLEISPAARFDRHSDVGTTYSWQLASAFQVNESLQVRGSMEFSRQAPSMSNLYLQELVNYPFVCDTKIYTGPVGECDELQVETLDRGNPLLKPDKSRALNVGATTTLDDFSLSIDLFNIQREDVPAFPDPQYIVDQDAAGNAPLPGVEVIRDAGSITRIVRPVSNDGEVSRTGADLSLKTQRELDSMSLGFDLYWHYTDKYETIVSGDLQPLDFPRNRAQAVLSASRDKFTASWNVYGIGSYERYKRWIGHDLMFSWQGEIDRYGDIELNAGILNVADRGPSIDSADPSQADTHFDAVRGRTVMLSLRSKW